MPLLLLVVLAAVQGVTEFLPISSSAHLVLTRAAWGGLGLDAPPPDPIGELTLDVALHVGTLVAVAVYFRKDVVVLIEGGFGLLRGRREGAARLAWLVLVATIPAILAGALLKDFITGNLRGLEVIAWTTLVFGVLLGFADRKPTTGTIDTMSWRGALAVGVAQAFALIPGVSRSGVAMTAARWLGLNRAEAARFALLLALPTIAGDLGGIDLGLVHERGFGRDHGIGQGRKRGERQSGGGGDCGQSAKHVRVPLSWASPCCMHRTAWDNIRPALRFQAISAGCYRISAA